MAFSSVDLKPKEKKKPTIALVSFVDFRVGSVPIKSVPLK